ncbi:MAG: O-antigen ligase family protein [Thermodesulfobacteriota bacterium]
MEKKILPAVLLVFFAALFAALITFNPVAGAILFATGLFIALILIRPHWGFYLAFIMAPLSNVVFMYESPIRIVSERYSPIIIPISLTAAALMLKRVTSSGNGGERRRIAMYGLLFLIFLWTVTTYFWTIDVYHGVNSIYGLAVGIALYVLILNFIRNEEDLVRLLKITVLWGFLLTALFLISNKVDLKSVIFEPLTRDTSFQINVLTSDSRPGGFAPPQTAGNIMGFIFFMGIAIFPRLKRTGKILLVCLGLMLLSAILSTSSKGVIGAFFIATAFFVFAYPKTRQKILSRSFVFVTAFASIFIFNVLALQSDRLVSSSHQAELSLTLRLEFWAAGLNMMKTHWLGGGVGGFASVVDPWPGAHSFYFSILFDIGIIGLVLFFLFIGRIVLQLGDSISRVKDHDMERYLYCMAGALVMFLVQGVVEMSYSLGYFWMLIGLVAATINIACNTEARGRDDGFRTAQ